MASGRVPKIESTVRGAWDLFISTSILPAPEAFTVNLALVYQMSLPAS